MYYTVHMTFGDFVRSARERLKRDDARFSVRQVARRVGVEPAYLSKVERNHVAPPSETKICRLAAELGEDEDVMLALGGKIATDLQQIIRHRPQLFGSLLRHLGGAPEEVVSDIERQVKERRK
jgi:transcriptional regulator with XRE-family HTH domain